jgi:hypothetical protein
MGGKKKSISHGLVNVAILIPVKQRYMAMNFKGL